MAIEWLGPFVYVFLVLVMEVSEGIVSYGAVDGVRVGRATAENVIGQMINEFVDRCDVYPFFY
jgi:hypothetical protein